MVIFSTQKMSFRDSKRLQKFRTRKTAKNSKLPTNYFELVGIGGWPSISKYINPPSLGRNVIQFFDFRGEREIFLLNLHLDALFSSLDRRCLDWIHDMTV